MSETAQKKSILYVDTGDEITSIIARLQDAEGKIAAIVLPKRAPAFQSVINIRLLKKAAEKAKKRAVLITSDKTILPLAGAAGIHVARTTESKPYIPDAPKTTPKTTSDNEVDPRQPVGDLAEKAKEDQDTIDIGDLPDLSLDEEGTEKPKKKRSGIKVPNFNKFRLWLILGGVLLVLLLVGWYVAAFVLPRAEITVETSTQSVAETFEFDAILDLDGVDEENFAIPATQLTYVFEDDTTVETTGEVNVGDRASGTVNVVNCSTQGTITIQQGTSLIAADGTAYRATRSVTIPESSVSGTSSLVVCNEDGNEDVPIEAPEPGSDFNTGSTDFSVEGFSSSQVYGSGSASGGNDDIESAVTSRDISAGREQLQQAASPEAETELEQMLEVEGLVPILESFEVRDSSTSESHEVGDQTDELTVSITTEYAMLGVSRDDIQELIRLQLGEEFDFERQSIVDDGLDQASLRIVSQDNDTTRLRLRTIVAIGAEIDVDALTEEIAGLSRSETEATVFLRDGVRDVQISYEPFYVFSTPDDTEKISITIRQAGDQAEDADTDEPVFDDEDNEELE